MPKASAQNVPSFLFRASPWIAVALLLACGSFAQQPAGAGTGRTSPLPDSPQPKQEQTSQQPAPTGRFVGYATSRSIIFPDIATSPNALTPAGKFKIFANQAISPAYVLSAGVSAAYNQARNQPAAAGQGWDAYGTRVGYSIGRASTTSFFGTFLFASMLHQDPRFFPEYKPRFGHAMKYSFTRLFVTRNDAGKDVFNSSGLLGPVAAEALANVYLPRSEQKGSETAQRIGTDLGWRFFANMFKEYWPTIFKDMHLQSLKVLPNPGEVSKP